MTFETVEDQIAWIRQTRQVGAPLRNELAKKMAASHCLYEGIQWIQEAQTSQNRYGYRRLDTHFSPDAGQLRVTANQISYRVQKIAASTYPDRIAVEAATPDRDFSVTTHALAKASQDAVNAVIDEGECLAAARRANFSRCVAGTWGLGFTILNSKKQIDGKTVDDCAIKFFDFDPLKLTLDPFIESGDLNDHDVVVYSDAWTHQKITRELGIDFNAQQLEKLQEIGALTLFEQELSHLSGGRLMSQYRAHSKTKGAMVHQIHTKSPGSSYFDRLHVLVETPERPIPVGGLDGEQTPFGGCGMGLVLLHAHQRPRSPWGISDVMMMRDDQVLLNLFKSMEARMTVKSAGWQHLVDKRSMPKGVSDEDARAMFTNTTAGVVFYDSSDGSAQPPKLVVYPQPPQNLSDSMEWHANQIREKAHRAEGTFGQTKSHVPDASFQRALDEADQVLGARVREDIRAYETLFRSLLGTIAKLTKDDAPAMLASLKRAGLAGQELIDIAAMDPVSPIIRIAVRESSVRFRSHNARKQDLQIALQGQAIGPMQYRTEAARLDEPIVHMDGLMVKASVDAVQEILLGAEWQPVPLGEYSVVFRDAFLAAIFDKKATPESEARFRRAIAAQLAQDAKERSLSDPALDIQRQQAEEQAMAQTADDLDQQIEGQAMPPSSLQDVLDAMQQPTSAASGGTSIPNAEATIA